MAEEPPRRPARERVFAVNGRRPEPAPSPPVLTAFGEMQSRRTLEIRAKTGGTLVELAETIRRRAARSRRASFWQDRPGRCAGGARPCRERSGCRGRGAMPTARWRTRARRACRRARPGRAARTALRASATCERGVGTAATVEAAELAAAAGPAGGAGAPAGARHGRARVDQARTRLARARSPWTRPSGGWPTPRSRAGFAGRR